MSHTMNDVARLAGVSPATVSRVLSKSSFISEKTAKRVMAVVEELQYHRNVHARRLAIGKSDLFGLVISEIANPYFSEIIRGFQSAAWDRGFDVLLLNTEYIDDRIRSVARKLIENDVRGVAIMTSSFDDKMVSSLTNEGIGVVLSGIVPASHLLSNIEVSYQSGVTAAIEHVASLGHRRAAVIAGPPTNRTASLIKRTLVDDLRRRGLKPDPVTHSDYHLDAGASAVKAILSAKQRPTVIFCGSDLIAMGAMMALEEAGLNVPKDISVVGIDDIPFAHLARPPLTTIHVPREKLGIEAFEALDRMLKLKRQSGAEYRLETNLVIRKSTAAAANALAQDRSGSRQSRTGRHQSKP